MLSEVAFADARHDCFDRRPLEDPGDQVIMKTRFLALAILSGLLVQMQVAHAEEGGSGHYLPGAMSSLMDAVPPKEAFVSRLNLVYYDGSLSSSKPLPISGLQAVGADATSWALGLTLVWRPPIDLGDRWSYALSTTIPFVWMDVEANVTAGGVTAKRTSSVNGLGDLVLMPLMLNYNVNPDLNVNFRVAGYAPTGNYEVGRLANTGKNFWTVEPTLALMYLGQKNGIEASLFFGSDFNWENPDTDYRSGTQLHVDGTLAQHFPLFGGLAGVGINAYWYEQVTGDGGSGATFGNFRGRTAGLGPVLSQTVKVGGVDVIGEVKWLPELETRRRLDGDIVWFKLIAKF